MSDRSKCTAATNFDLDLERFCNLNWYHLCERGRMYVRTGSKISSGRSTEFDFTTRRSCVISKQFITPRNWVVTIFKRAPTPSQLWRTTCCEEHDPRCGPQQTHWSTSSTARHLSSTARHFSSTARHFKTYASSSRFSKPSSPWSTSSSNSWIRNSPPENDITSSHNTFTLGCQLTRCLVTYLVGVHRDRRRRRRRSRSLSDVVCKPNTNVGLCVTFQFNSYIRVMNTSLISLMGLGY